LKARLQELKREARTVLFTSHALTDVAEICDRLAVMHGGTLRFAGTPAALCAQYSAGNLEQAFCAALKPARTRLRRPAPRGYQPVKLSGRIAN